MRLLIATLTPPCCWPSPAACIFCASSWDRALTAAIRSRYSVALLSASLSTWIARGRISSGIGHFCLTARLMSRRSECLLPGLGDHPLRPNQGVGSGEVPSGCSCSFCLEASRRERSNLSCSASVIVQAPILDVKQAAWSVRLRALVSRSVPHRGGWCLLGLEASQGVESAPKSPGQGRQGGQLRVGTVILFQVSEARHWDRGQLSQLGLGEAGPLSGGLHVVTKRRFGIVHMNDCKSVDGRTSRAVSGMGNGLLRYLGKSFHLPV